MKQPSWRIVWILLLALAVAITFIVWQVRKTNSWKNQASSLSVSLNTLGGQVGVYQKQNGLYAAKVEALQVEKSQLQGQIEIMVDQAAKIAKIHRNRIKELTAVTLETTDSISIPLESQPVVLEVNPIIPEVEKLPVGDLFDVSNKWADIKAWVVEDGAIGLTYTVRDSITFTAYERKKGFLGMGTPDRWLEGVSHNPNTRISGIDNVIIKDRPKPFSFGVQTGVGFNGDRFAPYLGVGVTYSLLRW